MTPSDNMKNLFNLLQLIDCFRDALLAHPVFNASNKRVLAAELSTALLRSTWESGAMPRLLNGWDSCPDPTLAGNPFVIDLVSISRDGNMKIGFHLSIDPSLTYILEVRVYLCRVSLEYRMLGDTPAVGMKGGA